MYRSQLSHPWKDPVVIDLTGEDDCEQSPQQCPPTVPQTAHVTSENSGRVGQRFNLSEGLRGLAERCAARHNEIAANAPQYGQLYPNLLVYEI